MTARESLTMSKRSANILLPEMAESVHRSFWSGFCLLRICNMRRSGNCREERKEDCINLLLIDEAGNYLDIPTLTILEDYLNSFQGIVITISHDRYFLDNVVDRIFEFDGNGHLQQYEGGYTDYLEAKKKRAVQPEEKPEMTKSKNTAKTWKQNSPVKLKFSFKEAREYETIDDEIASLEEQLEKLEQDMLKNATNSVKLSELVQQKEETQAALDEKMERWVYLSDLAEKIESQKNGQPV